jgi:hypothetical protein
MTLYAEAMRRRLLLLFCLGSAAVGALSCSDGTSAANPDGAWTTDGANDASIADGPSGTGTATLTWSAPDDATDTAIAGYNLYWATDRYGARTRAGSVDAATSSYAFRSLPNATEVWFFVVAYNAVGESDDPYVAQRLIP